MDWYLIVAFPGHTNFVFASSTLSIFAAHLYDMY